MVDKDSKNKFTSDGYPLLYRGTTIVSMMNCLEYPIFKTVQSVISEILKEDFKDNLRILPSSSMHMTIMSLLRDIDRNTCVWPSYIDRNASWGEIDKTLNEKLINDVKPLGKVFMTVDRVNDVSIRLSPYSEDDRKELTRFRDEVAKKLNIKHNGHDEYQYHMSYAYRIKDYTHDEKDSVEKYCRRVSKMAVDSIDKFQIANPTFVIFNDMLSYYEDLSKRK